jgi:hypothetical protein
MEEGGERQKSFRVMRVCVEAAGRGPRRDAEHYRASSTTQWTRGVVANGLLVLHGANAW